MPSLHAFAGATYLLQILVSAFLAILFLQSGINKVVDRRGNVEWLKGHFAKSPLAGNLAGLLIAITILQNFARALSAIGWAGINFLYDFTLAFYGAVVFRLAIRSLLFCQRV